MLTSCRRTVEAGIVTGMLAATVLFQPAFGQMEKVHLPDNPATGTRTNLFATWEGSNRMDGLIVELPAGWSLMDAAILSDGYKSLGTRIDAIDAQRYRVLFDEPIRDRAEIVLGLQTGESQISNRVEVAPLLHTGFDLQSRPSLGLTRTVRVREESIDFENQVLSFEADDAEPLTLRRDAAPDLGLRHAFRLSFWMKTTGLGEVVLSTWNGDNRMPYPVELVIDQAGRLRAYRGRPGEHHSIGSRSPVADGLWHRVELHSEPAEGWTWLRVDGERVDSLYSPMPPDISMELPLVLGGRSEGDDPYFDGLRRYGGLVDELEVRAAGDAVTLAFEDRVPREWIDGSVGGTRRVHSDRVVAKDIRDFRVDLVGDGVLLTWKSSAPEIREFVVERSTDGEDFEAIERLMQNPDGSYSYHDHEANARVVFYRVRQILDDEAERVSATIKVGIGEEQPSSAALIGNYPNPFNASTTITYEVREMTDIQLAIWDLAGQPIRTLVDRAQDVGTYQARFDADNLPSGTYFVRLRTPEGVKSHKIILAK